MKRRKVEIDQLYARLTKDVPYAEDFTKDRWYPVTTHGGICGHIVDNKGLTYLLDLDIIKSNMVTWECKTFKVVL